MIKLIYPVYFAIIMILIAKGISNLLFSHKGNKKRLLDFLKVLITAPFFPLFCLHSRGRRKLFNLIKK